MKEIISSGLAELGLADRVPEHAPEQLAEYGRLMLEKNQVMNLTAIREEDGVAQLHMLDSAALLNWGDFEGKTLLTDFCKDLNVNDDEFADIEGDADTLAGLLLEIKGDFPSMHEKIDYKNYTFEVMAIEERRISKVKVTVHEKKYVKEEEKD